MNLKEYEAMVRYGGMRISPRILLALGLLMVLGGVALYITTGDLLYLILLLVLADLIVFVPYLRGRRLVEEVEENLADALRQMAAVLRSGGTFEVAAREIAASDYGQLSKEFARMLREMEGGKPFTAAFESMALRVRSDFLEKVATIIMDAVRTGGRVADVLEELAEDVRKLYQIKKERRARTTMQFMFLAVSSAILGPFLMGVAAGISRFMVEMAKGLVASGTLDPALYQEKKRAMESMEDILTLFVIIESILSGFMAAQMRESDTSKGFIYAPLFLLAAYLLFVAGRNIVIVLTGIR